jgi:hypothetical protein
LSVNATFVEKHARKKTIQVHTGVSDLPRSIETPANYEEYRLNMRRGFLKRGYHWFLPVLTG